MTPLQLGLGYLLAAAILLLTNLAHAHPLGNNTVNRAALIQVTAERVSIRYLLDLAEIPTLLAAQEADTDGDGAASPAEWAAYARRRGEQARAGIDLSGDGRPLPLVLVATRWRLSPGEAGLDTLRLEARLGASLPGDAPARIDYRDRRHPDEAGWKEVVATAGKGMRLARSDAPATSPSRELTAYPPPEDAAPDALSARIEARATAVAPASAATASRPLQPTPTGPATAQSAVESGTALAGTAIPAGQPAGDAAHTPSTFLAFFRLGVHHIATGWDHLVFLLGLVVAQPSLRRLAWVVTAFTLAHSLTLGLAAGGLVTPPGDWVEPAIALTIAYVGLANLLGRLRHGAEVAFAFGLIHGFGFAGALADSLQGSLGGGPGWLLDLAAFNLGIEAFQLALVLLLLPVLHLGARLSWSGLARQAASLGVLGAGLGWFFSRV